MECSSTGTVDYILSKVDVDCYPIGTVGSRLSSLLA